MIVFERVTKTFGSTRALDEFTLEIAGGKITGLFGPNGAGKSTCLKMIAGLTRPDAGRVLIDGETPGMTTKSMIAYLPEIDYLYPWMTINDAVSFFAGFYEDWDGAKYQDLLSFLQLEPSMMISKISKGMRAKVKLLLTFSRRARYVLLDEPLSGIDILTRDAIIRTIVKDYSTGEQTIILSTHEIQEVEGLVEDVVFIDRGRVKLAGTAENLRQLEGRSLAAIMKEVFRHGND
ncbi:ABC transporter ATP-binding protein [Neomoorella humiferrea]|uniref:ABC transporter ATP-binding protein n=1 Tax=Neomoorella humiferrea TaxID=676965 RepID=UPI003D8C1616